MSTSSDEPAPIHPFYTLPSEIIRDIVDLLEPEALISFAFADYHLMVSKGLAPVLSTDRIIRLAETTQTRVYVQVLPFPAELILHVLSLLCPIDMMRFAIANYQDLVRQGIAPVLTADMLLQLQLAVP